MNRTRPDLKDFTPVFLATADTIGDRAARAMCPNGGIHPLALSGIRNVITLQSEFAVTQECAQPSACQQDEEQAVFACCSGNGEATSRGAANEH